MPHDHQTGAPEWCLEGSDGRTLRGIELERKIAEASQSLEALGARRIAFVGDNGVDAAVLFESARRSGICLIPLPPYFTPDQIRHAMTISRCGRLISGLSPASDESEGAPAGSPFDLGDATEAERATARFAIPAEVTRITFTSGSTGTPKGIALREETLARAGEGLSKAVGAHPDDRHLAILPLSLLLEEVVALHAARTVGATVILPSLGEVGFTASGGIDGDLLVGSILQYCPTILVLTPALLAELVSSSRRLGVSFETIRFVAVGGAPVSPRLLDEAHRLGIPAYEGYGLTEAASCIALNTEAAQRRGTVGRVIAPVEVRLEPDGEIAVAGNVLWGTVDESGFHRAPAKILTGDLGSIDEDGFVSVSGRKKNVIITSHGRNVCPEWVERTLEEEPAIARAFVFGDGSTSLHAVIEPAVGFDERSITRAVESAGSTLPEYAKIGSWVSLCAPISVAAGTLHRSGKPIRSKIHELHAALL